MRRRGGSNDDSLELLLDTICNMFGGLIFIAMLLAIFAGAQGASLAQRAGAASASEVLKNQTELERLESLVPALELAAEDTSKPTALDAEPSYEQVIARLETDVEQAAARLKEVTQRLENVRAKGKSMSEKLRDAAATADELGREIERLKAAIDRENRSKIANARLPVMRTTQKRPAHLIITGQRIYELIGPNGKPVDQDVEVIELSGGKIRVNMKASGGYAPGLDLSAHPRWKHFVSTRASDRYFIYIIVRADSFETFRAVKEAVLRAGYEYDVSPLLMGADLIMSPATTFTTQ